EPENGIGSRARPVLQGRLLEILQTVEPRCEPVTARYHLPGNFGIAAFVRIEHRAHLQRCEPGHSKHHPAQPPESPSALPPRFNNHGSASVQALESEATRAPKLSFCT